jgi:hypothetical protein
MARVTTDSTLYYRATIVACEAFWAFKRAMTFLPTNLAKFVFLESTVQESQLAELLLLVDISFVIHYNEHLGHHLACGVYSPLVISRNHHM